MPRNRKKAATAENHERWLVSYADFITLLFAFFVVMFAASQRDKDKAKQVSESVRAAIEGGGMAVFRNLIGQPGSPKGNAEKPAKAKALPPPVPEGAELLPSLQYLNRELKKDIEDGKIQVSFQNRGMVISLRAAAFFPSGDDHINESTYPSMGKIATVLRKLPNPVRLEGHTDSIPIHNGRFRSNWELSAARAISVMELFTTHFDLPAKSFAITGYAENLPVDTNETLEGRAHNRRVDIVVLSSRALMAEERPEPIQQAPPPPPGASGSIGPQIAPVPTNAQLHD